MYEKVDKCPACGNYDLRNEMICKDHLVTGESFAISRCSNCHLLITNPRPDEMSIGKYYRSDLYLSHNANSSLVGKLYRLAQHYTLWYKYKLITQTVGKNIKLLDYGCGVGDFLQYMRAKRNQVIGIEPSPVASDKAKLRGLNVYSSLPEAKEAESKFDVITLWHVLEHIHDLNNTIKLLKKLLTKKGFMLVAVPNVESWDNKMYSTNWAAYDVPRHLYHFNEKNITLLFKQYNLKLKDKQPLYLDSFYISLLSEEYATGKKNLVNSIINGFKSNTYGLKNGQYSSNIYIFQKK